MNGFHVERRKLTERHRVNFIKLNGMANECKIEAPTMNANTFILIKNVNEVESYHDAN